LYKQGNDSGDKHKNRRDQSGIGRHHGPKQGEDHSDASALPTSDPGSTYKSFGGASDDWYAAGSWTEAEVEDPNFGVELCFTASAANTVANIDHVRVTVHYSQASIDVSGKAYQSEGGAALANGTAISVYKNGTTLVGNTTTSGGDGSWTVSNGFVSGDIITAYIDNDGTYDGAIIFVSDGASKVSADIYGGALIVGNDTGASITNPNISLGYVWADTADMIFSTTTGEALVVNSNFDLYVASSSKTYDPGGKVITQGTGDFRIATSSIAFLDTADNVIAGDIIAYDGSLVYINEDTAVNGGDIKTQGTANDGNFLYAEGAFTPTITLSGTGTVYDGNATSTFYNLTTSGSGNSTVSTAIIIANDLTVGSGTTLSGTGDITVNGGDVTGNGTINLTGGTFTLDGIGLFGGNTGWTFNELTFGDGTGVATTTSTGTGAVTSATTTIAVNQILDAGVSKTWNLTASFEPFQLNGSFLASSSDFVYKGTSNSTTTGATYYDLTIAPTSGSPTYLMVSPPSGSEGWNNGATFGEIIEVPCGAYSWAAKTNAALSDESDASTTLGANQASACLTASNFGFGLPNASSITGIVVEVEKAISGGSLRDYEVRLLKGGSLAGTDQAIGGNWPGTDTYISYGGVSNLWGTTWSVAEVKASDFGLPQHRPRLFMVGFKDPNVEFEFPKPIKLEKTMSDIWGEPCEKASSG